MRILCLLFTLFIHCSVLAVQCDAVFPNALQSHSNRGSLTVNSGVKVNNLQSPVLPFVSGSINANRGDSCGRQDCSVSGFAAEALNINGEFPSFNGSSFAVNNAVFGQGQYNTNTFGFVTLRNGTSQFSNNYRNYFFNGLTIEAGATVNLKPGTYWVKNLTLNSSNQANDIGINVIGNGTVYLYANNITVNANRFINGLTDTAALNIGTYGGVTFNSNSAGEGLIYALGSLIVNSGAVFTGAASAQHVTLNSNATVNYVNNLFSTYDFSSTCSNEPPKSLRASYQFNQTAWNGPNTVLDSSANNYHASPIGSVVPKSYSGGTCRVLDVPANSGAGQIDAVDTQLDLNDVGNQGSISFWYRSDVDWSDASQRQLIDASNQDPAQDKYFYVSLQSGQLQFGIEDDDDYDMVISRNGLNYSADQWVHITVQWNTEQNRARLYIISNGSGVVITRATGDFNGNIGDMDSLYVGDNRTSYLPNNSSAGSANGQFESVNIYNYELSQSDVIALARDEPECAELDLELVAHWPMNACAVNGDPAEVVDVVAGKNGRAINGADFDDGGKLCQTSEYDGTGGHINISHSSNFELANGSLSMWFQVYDLNHQNTSSRDALVLFSKDSTGNDNGGDHLTIYVSQNGRIRARHQSVSDDYNIASSANMVKENQWHHLVYTFGANGMEMYLDRQRVVTNNYNGGLEGNPEPIILGSGAWRTGNNQSAPEDLFDHFIGKIDDVRLYRGQLSQTDVDNLNSETSQDCIDCPVVEELTAHWPLDVCSLDGSSGEVIDIINGYNGTALSGASVEQQGKFCQSGLFDGDGDHLSMPHVDAFQSREGAISLWFNTDDLNHSNTSSQGGQGLISRDSSGYDNGGHLTIWLQPTGAFRVRHQDKQTNYQITTERLVSAQRWHHMVYSWGSRGMKLYLDGKQVGSNTQYKAGTMGNAEPIIFAANAWQSPDNESPPNTLQDFFKGKMDEIKFYRSQVTEKTVAELFAQSQYDCLACDANELVAQFQFEQEQEQWGGPNSVLDNSGNNNNGTAVGDVLPIDPSQQIACRAMAVPFNDSRDARFDALDTGVNINSLGDSGSISFWYRANQAWNSGIPRQLFDASTDLGNYNDSKYFYLAITGSGALDFNFEDINDKSFGATTQLTYNTPADEWRHIAVTWDLPKQQVAIYLDGVAQRINKNADQNLVSQIGSLDTLYIGDNRSDYLVANSSRNSADGEFDDVRIHNFQQTRTEVSADMNALTTCSFVYKYLIDHDSQGLTCEAERISIKACANESCSQLYDQDVVINMSPNNGWPDGGTVTIPANQQAVVSLSQNEAGTVTLDVVRQNTQCTGTGSGTCNMTFSDAGFQFIGAGIDSPFADQLAQRAFSNAQLRAVRTERASGSNVCVAALKGEQSVNFSMSCDDPARCLTNIATAGQPISSGQQTSIPLRFDEQGFASLSDFSYADAGQISLSAQTQIDGADIVRGTTQFVVQPARLNIATQNSTVFHRAGQPFSMQLQALGVEGGVLPNYQPKDLELSVKRIVPVAGSSVDGLFNYAQNATITATEAGPFENSAIRYSNGNVRNNSGTYTFDVEYSEYGQVVVDARDNGYFDYVINSATDGNVSPVTLGVFIPAYYQVTANAPQLSDVCAVTTGFTYLGQQSQFAQAPQLSVTAKNANQQTMSNFHDDSLWTWLGSAEPNDIVASDAGHRGQINLTISAGNPNMAVAQNGNLGSRKLTIENLQLIYSKSSDPYAPFSSALTTQFLPTFFTDNGFAGNAICYHQAFDKANPDDCDVGANIGALDDTNNVMSINNIAGATFRWGRLVIENGFGPETEDILLPVFTEFYDGNEFVKNLDDHCTALSFTNNDFKITDAQGAESAAIRVANSSFGMTSGQTLGFEGIQVENLNKSIMGEYRIELQPKSIGGITWDDYLQFDWNGAESGLGNPSAIVSFGQYRGNDRIIHWREIGN